MIRSDRELLARLSRANRAMVPVVMEMVERLDDGLLSSAGLRPLGEQLRQLGDDLIARADELDRTVDPDDY